MSQHQGHPLNTSTLLELASMRILIFLPSLDSRVGEVGVADDAWEAFTRFPGAEAHRGPSQDCTEEGSDPGAGLLGI